VSDQTDRATALAFQEELAQALLAWNEMPLPMLELQAIYTNALLVALGKYITFRRDKGELENCAFPSEAFMQMMEAAKTSMPADFQ
jgi:hypothetical protein